MPPPNSINFPGNTTVNVGQSDIGDFYYYTTNPSVTTQIGYFPITIAQFGPVTSTNYITVKIITPMTLSNISHYFICRADYMVFDGNDNLITVTASFYPGFIQNGTQFVTNPKIGNGACSNVTVRNIALESSNALYYSRSGLVHYTGGWICQAYFGNGATNCCVINCSSNAQIGVSSDQQSGGGGIVGDYSFCDVTNCHSAGEIVGENAGGIFGSYINCYNSGGTNICIAKNCYSKKEISGQLSGGIFGGYININNTGGINSCMANNCYSEGTISSGGCGGIFGGNINTIVGTLGGVGNVENNCIVNNCYSRGDITGYGAGGIVGGYTNNYCKSNTGTSTNNCVITNCYSTGNICGNGNGYNGGIIGTYANYNNYENSINNCAVTNCYSTGNIDNPATGYNGSIFAGYCNIFAIAGINNCTATNCYSTGYIDDSGGGGSDGGIFGGICNTSNTGGINTCAAINCYSTGDITNGSDCAGIFGGGYNGSCTGGTNTCTATNCYSVGFGSGIFADNSSDNFLPNGGVSSSKSYSEKNGNGTPGIWSDSHATYTTNWPYGLINVGSSQIWISMYPNTPFLLTCFNTNFYNGIYSAVTYLNQYTNLILSNDPLNNYPLTNTYSQYFQTAYPSIVNINSGGQMTSNKVAKYVLKILRGFKKINAPGYVQSANSDVIMGYDIITFVLYVTIPSPTTHNIKTSTKVNTTKKSSL